MSATGYAIKNPAHFSEFMSQLNKMRLEGRFTDVALWCDGRAFPCHRMILVSLSDKFKEWLEEDPARKIIALPGATRWEVKAILEFMYTGELTIGDAEKFKGLVDMAKELKIKCLEDITVEETLNIIRNMSGTGR